jgi:hypothetical protein
LSSEEAEIINKELENDPGCGMFAIKDGNIIFEKELES